MSNGVKFLVVSDLHLHAWSMFSGTLTTGVNERLQIILDELKRAAKALVDSGGSTMIIAGDIFHSRGVIDPEILNPTRDTFQEILNMGVQIRAIPGNHDLKSNETSRLSSSIENLSGMKSNRSSLLSQASFEIYNEPTATWVTSSSGAVINLGFVPWRTERKDLLKDLATLAAQPYAGSRHVFIHAGVDGALSGKPATGLTPKTLDEFGFKGVYAGDYHNFADLGKGLRGNVFSIGANTHQSWRDVGARAGFLIIDADSGEVIFNDNLAPGFVDISDLDETDMEIECAGNYVRFAGPEMAVEEIHELRTTFLSWGALGVNLQVPPKSKVGRSTSSGKSSTLESSITSFIDEMEGVPAHVDRKQVEKLSLDTLNEARLATD